MITEPIDNQNLFSVKKDLLSQLKHYNFHIESHKTYSFLGKVIRFHFSNTIWTQSISDFLPSTWQLATESFDYPVYFVSPSELNHDGEWSDESSQDCFLLDFEGHEACIQRDFISIDLKDKVLVCLKDSDGDGLYNFLRWYIPRKLLEFNQFIIHSSCVVDPNGQAHLFLGHSGAGKSTIADLSKDFHVIGDDMNCLFHKDGQIHIRAASLGGQIYENVDYSKSYPLKSCYWIHQSQMNELVLNSRVETAKMLLASVCNIFWDQLEQKDIDKIFDFCLDVSSQVNGYDLFFVKNSSFWKLLND